MALALPMIPIRLLFFVFVHRCHHLNHHLTHPPPHFLCSVCNCLRMAEEFDMDFGLVLFLYIQRIYNVDWMVE